MLQGLSGPTYHFGGLASGNLASHQHANEHSNPKLAAMQCLQVMRLLADLGASVAVMPIQCRPHLKFLHALGFRGRPEVVLQKVAKQDMNLLLASYSSAHVFVANAAHVCASCDARDGKVHITPANLTSNLHRMMEVPSTAKMLQSIFTDERYFKHHSPLPSQATFSDEGQANDVRLCDDAAVHLFCYGVAQKQTTQHFAARQSLAACQAVARLHRLDRERVIFAEQSARAIDAGVFHHDIVCASHSRFMMLHQDAFAHQEQVISQLTAMCQDVMLVEINRRHLSLEQAVESYLFNSQLVRLGEDALAMIAPQECQQVPAAQAQIDRLLEGDNPIQRVDYVFESEGMKNGGGPACLRLRLLLSEQEMAAVHPGVLFSNALEEKLKQWIDRYYRDRLSLEDLLDPLLIQEAQEACEALGDMLGIPGDDAFGSMLVAD